MAIDPKININENQVIYKRELGHNHDGLTSTLIDYTKYSIFDFSIYPVATPGTRRRTIEETNVINLKSFIVSAIEERVLNPQGIRIQANAITAREIVSGTITANELASNVILVNNVIKSKNYNGTINTDGDITAYGNTGWAITHAGESEFNNVFIRGGISANTGSIGGIVINSSSLYSSNYDSTHGFALYSDGSADFNNVSVRGEVIATSGSIADNFTIGNNIAIGSNTNIGNNLFIGNNVRVNGAAGDGGQSIVKIRADDSGSNPNNYPLNVVSYLNNLAWRVRYDGRCDSGGNIYMNGSLVATSDKRWKKDIEDSNLGLNFISSLKPVSYRFIDKEFRKSKNYGFISQDVKEICNQFDIDFGGWYLFDEEDIDGKQGIDYTQFIAPIVKSIQELSQKNEELEARLKALEGV